MDPLAPVVQALHAEARLRLWSLVITIFGDAVAPRGGRIAAARLRVLLERLGTDPGALRTAVSRLAADGWIEREKDGRRAFYRLSARGIAEFAPATRRIYAAPAPEPRSWTLGTGPAPAGAYPIGREAWLADVPPRGHPGIAVTGTLKPVPDAARDAAVADDHKAALSALSADIAALQGRDFGPLDAMAARTALIHRWRRIVLRWPEVPGPLLPAPLALARRSEVARLYQALLPASEVWLDDPALPLLRPAEPGLVRRFLE